MRADRERSKAAGDSETEKHWSQRSDSNRRPAVYESLALRPKPSSCIILHPIPFLNPLHFVPVRPPGTTLVRRVRLQKVCKTPMPDAAFCFRLTQLPHTGIICLVAQPAVAQAACSILPQTTRHRGLL